MPKIKTTSTTSLWFGSDESWFAVVAAQDKLSGLQMAGTDALQAAIKMAGGGRGSDPFALPALWEVVNGVAVVHINGSLVNGSAGFMRLFGVLGYSDIADALLEAAASKDAKQVLLSIDSGGGAVNGLSDVGMLIQQIDKVKPVSSYSDGAMFSAAYWLGVSARGVNTAETAQSGSVGTLIVHTDITKARADAGYKDTIFRYGKYKAVGHPLEPLSKEGEEKIQGLADAAGKIFVDYASERRGVSAEKFQKTMGEGRVFMGAEAKAVGLIDGVMNFSDAINFTKSLDNKKTPTHNSRNSSKDSAMKLSQKVLLAIAQGVKLEALGLSAADANVDGTPPDAAAIAALTAEATSLITARDATIATAVAAGVGETKAQLEKATTDLKAATDKVALLEAGTAGLTAKVEASNQIAASCSGIVKASISVMSVALGGAADTGAALSGAELVAEHTRLSEQFKKKFPQGGVAAVNPELTSSDKPASPPAAFLAALGNPKLTA